MWLKGIDKEDYPVTAPMVRENFTQTMQGRFVDVTRKVVVKIKTHVWNRHKLPFVNWYLVPGGYLQELQERLRIRGQESVFLLSKINELHDRLRHYES